MAFLWSPGDDPRTPELPREPHDVLESNDVAETDPARLIRTELDKGYFVSGDENPAALLGGEREDGLAVHGGKRRGQVALDLFGGRVGLYHEFPRHGLDADLDFHSSPSVGFSVLRPGRRCAASR